MLVYQCQWTVQIIVILKCSETWLLADYRLCACVSLCVVPEVGPTSISMMRPTKKEKRLTPKRKSSLRFLRRNTAGYMSTTAVTRLSTHTNWWDVGEKKGALVQFTTNTEYVDNLYDSHCVNCRCACTLCTWLSSPKKTIMMKKRAAHRGEKGIMLTARG